MRPRDLTMPDWVCAVTLKTMTRANAIDDIVLFNFIICVIPTLFVSDAK
jgi:hypothetical protein